MLISKKAKGFTLLEVLISIVIMSLILLMGFNTYSKSVTTQSEKNAASQIAFAIKNARYYAKKHGIVTEIILDENSKTYSIMADGVDITNSSDFGSTSGVLPDGNKIITNGCSPLMFYIDGTPITSESPNPTPYQSNCMITVGKSNKTERKIMLHATTGDTSHE